MWGSPDPLNNGGFRRPLRIRGQAARNPTALRRVQKIVGIGCVCGDFCCNYIVDFVIFSSYALGSGGISISMRGINRSNKLITSLLYVMRLLLPCGLRLPEIINYRASFHLSVREYSSQHRNYTKPALTMAPCDPWAGTCNG